VGARSAREQFLQAKIDHETATITKLINLPHQHALLVLRCVYNRACSTCSGPSSQTTLFTYGTSSTPPYEKP
jgi:hypothetical protein